MSLSGLIATLRPGQSVFLPGSTGEPMGLMEALAEEGAAPLDITSSYLPGINRVPVDRLPEGSRFRCLFAHPEGTAAARKRGVFRHLPLSYGAFMKHLGERARFDACIVHVSPPDQHGLCTLGPAVEFTDMVGRCSGRVLAVINSRLPALPHSVSLPLSRFAETAEADAPLREYDIGAPSALATAIAKHVATFVRDGSTLQVGLGKVPDALMRLVSDRKELKLFSGMLRTVRASWPTADASTPPSGTPPASISGHRRSTPGSRIATTSRSQAATRRIPSHDCCLSRVSSPSTRR
jgi:acyl-CoA hydrolase